MVKGQGDLMIAIICENDNCGSNSNNNDNNNDDNNDEEVVETRSIQSRGER